MIWILGLAGFIAIVLVIAALQTWGDERESRGYRRGHRDGVKDTYVPPAPSAADVEDLWQKAQDLELRPVPIRLPREDVNGARDTHRHSICVVPNGIVVNFPGQN